jgi:CRP-like cAMP-binding protein
MWASRTEGNKLLGSFTSPVLKRLDPRTRRVESRQTLFDAHRQSIDVFFPHAGTVVSLIRETNDGRQIEVGLIGAEGFAGIGALLGGARDWSFGTVQSGGEISCVSATRLREEFAGDANTRELLMSYASMVFQHLTQSVVCNSAHTIEQRLSKWLLILSDRIDSDEMHVSHELLAHMLGIQRSGVTLAIRTLTQAGLISHSRRLIRVREPKELKFRACECYGVMLRRLDDYREQLTPPQSAAS